MERNMTEPRCPALAARKNAAGETEKKCFIGMKCGWCNIPAEQAEELVKQKKKHILSSMKKEKNN